MKKIFIILILLTSSEINSQDRNYFYEIKKIEDNYSNNSIVSRFIHSVGFRYYWATEGLRDQDLSYKPSETGI